ncbi:hypothetical protein HDE_04616 [Halotydeus destructor]|nr:hypothetical protein HDE_04616 [Halotydeus destructor]
MPARESPVETRGISAEPEERTGFLRGLEPDEIVGTVSVCGLIMYRIRWKTLDGEDISDIVSPVEIKLKARHLFDQLDLKPSQAA